MPVRAAFSAFLFLGILYRGKPKKENNRKIITEMSAGREEDIYVVAEDPKG
jgi:hypothetical protein